MDLVLAIVLSLAVTLAFVLLARRWPKGTKPLQIVPLPALPVFLTFAFWGTSMGGRAFTIATAVGCVVISTVGLGSKRRRLLAIARAAAEFSTDDPRRARNALSELIGPPPSLLYRDWAGQMHFLAVSLARAGHYEEAVRWANQLDVERLDASTLASRAQLLAAVLLLLGHRERARSVLGSVPRPAADRVLERSLTATSMLVESLTGGIAGAELASREALVHERDPAIRATWHSARAHALAALGRRDEALQSLRSLVEETKDPAPLQRVVRHDGPASELAQAVLSENRG